MPTTTEIELKMPDALAQGAKAFLLGQIKGVRPDSFEAEVVISTSAIDRDREVVEPAGMVLPKPRRIPLVSSHSYSDLRKQIGDVPRIRVSDSEAVAVVRYFAGMGNAEADWAWTLVGMGVPSYSIGFLPMEVVEADLLDEKVIEKIRAGKLPLRRYTKWELAEVSHVIVPSNREAIMRMIDVGVLAMEKEQVDVVFKGLKDEPLSADAQKAFDKALETWAKTREEQITVKDVSVSVSVNVGDPAAPSAASIIPEKQPEHPAAARAEEQMQEERAAERKPDEKDRHNCPEGHVYNPETGNCEKKEKDTPKPVPPAAGPAHECPDGMHWDNERNDCIEDAPAPESLPKGFDLMSLFAEAGKKVSELKEQAKPKGEKGAVTVQINFDEDILPKLEEHLAAFQVEMLKRIDDAVESAISKKFGPDSAAHTNTKDLIAAVFAGVKTHVAEQIGLARGNVDMWLKS